MRVVVVAREAMPIAWRVACLVACFVASLSACVAPVRFTGPAAPPDEHPYVGRHGRPIAYGGGVCPVEARHRHPYPPVPRAHFVDDDGAARDTRNVTPYFDPHPHTPRTCFASGLHYHLEEPVSGMAWSDEKAAYRAPRAFFDGLLATPPSP